MILQLDEERWRLVVKCLRFVNRQATNEVADTIEERLDRGKEQQQLATLRILEMVKLVAAIDDKTDAEVADLIDNNLMDGEDMIGPKYQIIYNAVERLRRADGGPLEIKI